MQPIGFPYGAMENRQKGMSRANSDANGGSLDCAGSTPGRKKSSHIMVLIRPITPRRHEATEMPHPGDTFCAGNLGVDLGHALT
jgi:hypothetical protein